MAFTTRSYENQRYIPFMAYTTKNSGALGESLAFNGPFLIGEIRAHFSVAFASVRDFIVSLSCAEGSAHNVTWLSQAMNGVQDLVVHYSEPLLFGSGDTLNLSFFQSTTNILGLNVIGWAVRN